VNAARTHIQARYVFGLSPEKCQAYKAMSNHRLNEDPSDIQAEIVRTGAIEVPEKDDPRLDQAIFDQFEHAKLVRVFLPLKLLPGYEQVIGTLEVAYDRGAGSPTSERDVRIYESDVQLLENLLRSTMRRIELRELGLLEKLPHEFRSPIVGIRNQAANLLFLRERSDNKALVDDRLNDILTDCQTLLNLVSTLEHGLGRPRHKPKLQPTAVFRDVVIKSVRQLRPFAEREGFDADRILYLPYDSHRITIYTDRASLSQVATNLITNAIKYAKDDPRDFSIAIKVAETRTNYLIHFEDRGIGVPAGSEDRIFEEGYRASNAIARNITGSGLGLTISREIMLELGGDLWLTSEPGSPVTVFTMVLPKYLANKPED
jgi:signal transduction histidine kinase